MNRPAKFLLFCNCFALAMSVSSVARQENTAGWWKASYEEGMELFQKEQFEAAEKQFKRILAIDKKVPEAHYGLGMVYNKQEPGSKNAKSHLKKAIQLNRDFAAAFYQLALVYKHIKNRLFKTRRYLQIALQKDPTLVDAWYELSKVEEELWPYADVVNIYMNGVKKAPHAKILFSHFINAALWYHKENKALSTLNYLIKKYPEEPEYLFGLAEIHYALEEYEKSSAILDSMQAVFPNFTICRRYLLQAKIYFEMDRTDEGLGYYISAINTIRDSTDANAVYNDVCYIMRDKEYDGLQTTALDSIRHFYHRFWRSRDPNLATKESERIIEHYKRLSYARRNYRRYLPGYKQTESMYASTHPYAFFNVHGEQLLRETHLPKALDGARDLDDLGLIYVRHGEPDQQVTSFNGLPDYVNEIDIRNLIGRRTPNPVSLPDVYALGRSASTIMVPKPSEGENLLSLGYFDNMPMNLSWKYYARNNRSEMIFHFKKFEGNTGWIMEAIPYTVAERELLDVRYKQLGTESFRARPDGALVAEICKEFEVENRKHVKIGMQTETTDYGYTEKQLPVPFQIITFKGENDKILVELYYGIIGKETGLDTCNNKNLLKLHRFIGFFDERWNEKIRLNKEDNIQVNVTPEEWKKSAILNVERFSILPGRYNYEIHFRDKTSNRLAVYKGEHIVSNYWDSEFMLSDIILSGPIYHSDENSRFKKENIIYSPHMFAYFKKGEPVGLYFELYHLSYDSDSKTNFQITCSLQPFGADEESSENRIFGFFKSLLGKEEGKVGTSYIYSGHTSDEQIYLNFDVGEKRSGKYELVISAQDLNAKTKVTRKVGFKIK